LNYEQREFIHLAEGAMKKIPKKTATKRASKKSATNSTEAPATQVAGFIAKFDPKIARLIRSARSALRKRFPTANELVYDNYNFFVIGYSSTERPSDCIVSLAANAKGIGLSFYYGSSLPDPDKLLQGSGTQNRFIRLESAAMLAQPAVERLIQAAVDQSEIPLPPSAHGRTIIRSISEKQRPRRTPVK
jgi:hypothetical protein